MNYIVLSIFPEMFNPFWEHGIIKRALERDKITATALDIRDYATDRHQCTDDKPFGGGSGMLFKPEPLAGAIRDAQERLPGARTVFLTPQGETFNQKKAFDLSTLDSMILICGRYEGIDERICQEFVQDEISIGDYVLTGGEIAAMVVMDAVTRLIPGVLGGEDSAEKETFSEGLVEHAHYTRPRDFEGLEVPDVLLSGNHAEIDKWRLKSSLIRTFLKRPDLLQNRELAKAELTILKEWCRDIEKIVQG